MEQTPKRSYRTRDKAGSNWQDLPGNALLELVMTSPTRIKRKRIKFIAVEDLPQSLPPDRAEANLSKFMDFTTITADDFAKLYPDYQDLPRHRFFPLYLKYPRFRAIFFNGVMNKLDPEEGIHTQLDFKPYLVTIAKQGKSYWYCIPVEPEKRQSEPAVHLA